ncbi:MAG: UDP binding domain-containing protein, partial [Patescibacteria group bacterium]
VSNPEFLVEGKAIEGTVRPDRIVVGASKEEDFAAMRRIYQRFYSAPNVKYIEVNAFEAAAGKLLANFVLFNRLATTYDVVGRVAENWPEINFECLRRILTSDERIGKWGFYDSVYAGGSCFIKDAASLAHQLEEAGANAALIRQTLASNRFQRDHFLSRAKEAGFEWSGKSVAILGVAFKRDTNDVRNSPALDLTEYLVDAGVKEIRVYDPSAVPMFKSIFNPEKDARFAVISYHETEEKALLASEASIILTDWPQFRSLGEKIAKICKPPYLIMDGRRMIAHQYEELAAAGYAIIAVGSPLYKSL